MEMATAPKAAIGYEKRAFGVYAAAGIGAIDGKGRWFDAAEIDLASA